MSTTLTRIRHIAALLLMVASVLIASVPKAAFAAAGNPSYCHSDVDLITNQNLGTDVPVIMVHGFTGHSYDWGSVNNGSSFAGRVNNIPGVAVAQLFNYNTYGWVTDPERGPKLAKTIDCVSQLSEKQGGPGKVIIVGYSMGGLMVREAATHLSTNLPRSIADEIGQVITIATPHTEVQHPAYGPITTALISTLPNLPLGVPVHTIAGDIENVYYNSRGQVVRREQTHSDTLTSTESAHWQATSSYENGGGTKTITCEKRFQNILWWSIPNPGNAPCEHGVLISNANNGVREDTIEAIQKYVASLEEPESISLTVGPLTTTYDNRWGRAEYGASGPGEDATADDLTNTNAFIQIFNMDGWCGSTLIVCATGGDIIDTAPEVTVGGRMPDASARYIEPGSSEREALAWCFTEEQVCINYRRAGPTGQLEPSQALLDLLSSATWSD